MFTDENATCMIISEDIYVMLLVEKFFKALFQIRKSAIPKIAPRQLSRYPPKPVKKWMN
jgi:predicted lactoylglutathione lyase